MSTKLEPGPFDGLQRAEPDEPVFTLRAHDPLAADLVHEWVARRRKAIREAVEASPPRMDWEKAAVELIQCGEAEEIALNMTEWRLRREGEPAAVDADQPAPAKPTYSGITKSTEEIAAKAMHDAIKGACARLNNSVAEITDAAGLIRPYGCDNAAAVALAMASKIKLVSSHLAPKRASFYVGQPAPEPFDLKAGLVCINDLRAHMEPG